VVCQVEGSIGMRLHCSRVLHTVADIESEEIYCQ